MARVTIYLHELDHQALEKLAIQQFRTPKEQAGIIICAELERQGLLEPSEKEAEESRQ